MLTSVVTTLLFCAHTAVCTEKELQELRDLRQRDQQMTGINQAQDQTIIHLTKEKDSLQKQLDQSKQAAGSLRTEIQQQKKHAKALMAETERHSRELIHCQQLLVEQKDISKKCSKCTGLQTEIETLRTEKSRAEQELEMNLKSTKETLELSRTDLQKQRSKLVEERTLRLENRKQIQSLQGIVDNLEAEKRKRDAQISELEDVVFQQRNIMQEERKQQQRQFTQFAEYQNEATQSERDRLKHWEEHNRDNIENERGDAVRRLTESMKREEEIKIQKANEELQYREERDNLQREVEEKDQRFMMAMYIGGGILLVIGTLVMIWRWSGNKRNYQEMERALYDQRERMKRPHEPVPVFPSVHANRLGIHEHPAVRDVFGMKEPWDVTPGEGLPAMNITTTGGSGWTGGEGRGEGVDEISTVSGTKGEIADVAEEDLKAQIAELCENLNI